MESHLLHNKHASKVAISSRISPTAASTPRTTGCLKKEMADSAAGTPPPAVGVGDAVAVELLVVIPLWLEFLVCGVSGVVSTTIGLFVVMVVVGGGGGIRALMFVTASSKRKYQ